MKKFRDPLPNTPPLKTVEGDGGNAASVTATVDAGTKSADAEEAGTGTETASVADTGAANIDAADKREMTKAAADADKKSTAADAGDDIAVVVIGPANGRHRAGFHFGPKPTALLVTSDQLQMLKNDPLLSVAEGTLNEDAADVLESKGGSVVAPERLPAEAYLNGDAVKPFMVLGPSSGRHRAGFSFGPTETLVENATRAQLDAILADPLLSVQPV
jgi:hypothetical protein